MTPQLYVKIPSLRTFLDVSVGDAHDALAPIAPHEVGVAAVVEQREGGVDGGAERDLVRKGPGQLRI